MSDELVAVDLGECCRRLGISRRTGERLVAEGRFPIPALPIPSAVGRLRKRILRFSTHDIAEWLRDASVDEARPAWQQRFTGTSRRR